MDMKISQMSVFFFIDPICLIFFVFNCYHMASDEHSNSVLLVKDSTLQLHQSALFMCGFTVPLKMCFGKAPRADLAQPCNLMVNRCHLVCHAS